MLGAVSMTDLGQCVNRTDAARGPAGVSPSGLHLSIGGLRFERRSDIYIKRGNWYGAESLMLNSASGSRNNNIK